MITRLSPTCRYQQGTLWNDRLSTSTTSFILLLTEGGAGPVGAERDVRGVPDLDQVVNANSGAHGARKMGTLGTASKASLQTRTGGGERGGREERVAEEGGSEEHGKDARGEDASAREERTWSSLACIHCLYGCRESASTRSVVRCICSGSPEL